MIDNGMPQLVWRQLIIRELEKSLLILTQITAMTMWILNQRPVWSVLARFLYPPALMRFKLGMDILKNWPVFF